MLSGSIDSWCNVANVAVDAVDAADAAPTLTFRGERSRLRARIREIRIDRIARTNPSLHASTAFPR
jgi:hypothetical protein